MGEYQMYILGADGEFLRRIELSCPDDKSAEEYAGQVGEAHDLELWQGDRRIERFRPVKRLCRRERRCRGI